MKQETLKEAIKEHLYENCARNPVPSGMGVCQND